MFNCYECKIIHLTQQLSTNIVEEAQEEQQALNIKHVKTHALYGSMYLNKCCRLQHIY